MSHRLKAFVDHARRKLGEERAKWEGRMEIKAALLIQHHWELRRRRKEAAEAAEQAEHVAYVQRMRDNMEADASHRRKLYELELEKWYEDKRQERLAEGRMEEARSSKKTCNVSHYHGHFGFDCTTLWTVRLTRTACLPLWHSR